MRSKVSPVSTIRAVAVQSTVMTVYRLPIKIVGSIWKNDSMVYEARTCCMYVIASYANHAHTSAYIDNHDKYVIHNNHMTKVNN